MAPGETATVLMVYSDDGAIIADKVRESAFLWSDAKYFTRVHRSDLIYWFFFGALFAMIMYHFAGAVLNREKIYIYYVAFCSTYLLTQFSASGFAFQFLWPTMPALNIVVPVVSLATMATTLAYFTLMFLQPQMHILAIRRAVFSLSIFCFFFAIPTFFVMANMNRTIATFAVLLIVTIVMTFLLGALVSALFEWRRGSARGRQFTFSWALFMVAQTSGILTWLDVISTAGLVASYASMTGSLIAFGLISGYMAERANKAIAQQHVAKALLKVNQKLEAEVQDRKLAEEQAKHLANHDALTGLPSLRLARERLQQSMAVATRAGYKVAVLFVDLDGFKAINDRFGHEVGDHVLQQTAVRMEACLRESDTVARIGGDEFLVIQTEVREDDALELVADKLLQAVREPLVVEDNIVSVSASIGIAICPDHGANMRELMKRADGAMYSVKEAGKNSFRYANN